MPPAAGPRRGLVSRTAEARSLAPGFVPVWPGNDVALLWTANRPGSQQVVWLEAIALFQSASACPRAADKDRPHSALVANTSIVISDPYLNFGVSDLAGRGI